MAPSHDAIIARWFDRETGKTTKANLRVRHGNVIAEEGVIWSYGRHFALVRALRDKRGRLTAFLLNGDQSTRTTTGHQSQVRAEATRRGVPFVIIPESVLGAASIVLHRVQLVYAEQERTETFHHVSTTQPDGTEWRTEWFGEYRQRSPEDLAQIVAGRNASIRADWEKCAKWARDEHDDVNGPWTGRSTAYWQDWLVKHPEPKLITVDDLDDWDRREWVDRATSRQVLYFKNTKWHTVRVEVDDAGQRTYRWETYRHWLGESVIRAQVKERRADYTVRYRWAYFLSGFDHNEAHRSYFFCELPRGARPKTVAEAYEALKPETVKVAEQMGREVTRQGDIFALPTGLTRRELRQRGATFDKRAELLGTNHTATEVANLGGLTLGRGCLYHRPSGRAPDHARRKIGDGKTWHVIVKNTVPTER